MVTPDDKLIQNVAKDILGRNLTQAEMVCVRFLFLTGQVSNKFKMLSKSKQDEMKLKYGNLLVKFKVI